MKTLKKDLNFTNWEIGQTNNYVHENEQESSGGSTEDTAENGDMFDEDGVVLRGDGLQVFWNDYPIDELLPFVCMHTEYIAGPGISSEFLKHEISRFKIFLDQNMSMTSNVESMCSLELLFGFKKTEKLLIRNFDQIF